MLNQQLLVLTNIEYILLSNARFQGWEVIQWLHNYQFLAILMYQFLFICHNLIWKWLKFLTTITTDPTALF